MALSQYILVLVFVIFIYSWKWRGLGTLCLSISIIILRFLELLLINENDFRAIIPNSLMTSPNATYYFLSEAGTFRKGPKMYRVWDDPFHDIPFNKILNSQTLLAMYDGKFSSTVLIHPKVFLKHKKKQLIYMQTIKLHELIQMSE